MAQQLEQPLAGAIGEEYLEIRHRSQWNLVWHRFRRDKVALLASPVTRASSAKS